jgi:hypothetical protein
MSDSWDVEFAAWMKKMDAALEALCGMESGDLPDWNYADAFDDERDDFDDIAREVLEDAGYAHMI